MNSELEQSIKSVLDVVMLLKPISVRLVLNKNITHFGEEQLSLWYQGKTNDAFQETDSKFYGIMRTQKMIQIPSVERSFLLSNLSVGDAAAVFCPIQTEYGYYGVFWACFAREVFNDHVLDLFSNCCDWISSLLRSWLEKDFTAQAIANRYADLLEQLKAPALIIVFPEQLLISNACFESMKDMENVLMGIRETGMNEEKLAGFCKEQRCSIQNLDFPGGKTGKMMIFKGEEEELSFHAFDPNAIAYYQMLVQKARGQIGMLDSSGELSNLQKKYVESSDAQLKRLETIFSYGLNHFNKTDVGGRAAFEVIPIPEIVKEVTLDLAALARTKRVEIEMNIDKAQDRSSAGNAMGDAWLLTLMVYDLVDNAIRYSKTDGKPVRITVAFAEKNWRLSVEDSGIGIAPLDLENIRSKAAWDPSEEGQSALKGIPFIKYAVQLHHGTLSVESRLGKGSVFTVDIPYY